MSHISGNGNLKELLKFQKVTFQAQQIKKIHPEKIPYTLGDENP